MARRPPRVAKLVPAALVLLAGGALILGVELASLSGPPLVLFALASVVVIAHALDGRSVFARALSVGPVVFLGRISYGLDLWHQPILVWLGAYGGWSALDLVAVPLAVLVATASYYVVERPFLRLKRWPTTAPRTAHGRNQVTVHELPAHSRKKAPTVTRAVVGFRERDDTEGNRYRVVSVLHERNHAGARFTPGEWQRPPRGLTVVFRFGVRPCHTAERTALTA